MVRLDSHGNEYEDIIKSSRATSCINWLKYEDTDVSRAITALVLRVLKYEDVFWDVASCSLVLTDTSEELTASIIKVMNKPQSVLNLLPGTD
jgi:hypothetical protein